MLAPGTIFLDKYRIDRAIGRGGMGVVLAATHLHLQERVAIKVLNPEMAAREDVIARFLREAQAAVRLKGPHVARIIDVGISPDGVAYLVMEYLEGRDLHAEIRSRGTLPAAELVGYVLQACEAMAEAHACSIVHRDIKPANLFLTSAPDGTPIVKVLDFGISKALDRDLQLTGTEALLGTPAYMAPEQLRASRNVDARSDIWSLGVVLYEGLAGRLPFSATSFGELVLQVVTEPAPRLAVPAPRGLDAVIARCLERDPAARFPSIAELASALAPYAAHREEADAILRRSAAILRRSTPALGRPVLMAPPVTAPAATTLATSAGSFVTAPRPPRRLLVVVASALVTGIAIAAIAMRGSSDEGIADTPAEVVPATSPAPAAAPLPAPNAASATPANAAAPTSAVPVDAGADAVVVPPGAAALPAAAPANAATVRPPRPHVRAPKPAPPVDPLRSRI